MSCVCRTDYLGKPTVGLCVRKSQGRGTVSRESASSGKPTAGAVDIKAPYYRAVDQAIGLLACLEMRKMMMTR